MRFKLFGTKFQVTFLFAAVIAILLITDRTGLILPTVLAAAIHETGHLFAMWAAGCQPKAVKLTPAAVKIVRGYPDKQHGELAIALCGPAANLTVYITMRLWYAGCGGKWILSFALINLLLGAFNMLPVAGLDGGTVLRLFLEKRIAPEKAWNTVRLSGFFLGAGVLTAAVISTACGHFNPTVYTVALYFLLTALLRA